MAVALGMGMFICAFQALAIAGLFRPGATVALIFAGVAMAALQFLPWRRELEGLGVDAHVVPWTRFEKIAMAALALVALPALVEPLAPPAAFDEVMYHLPYARQVALDGSLGIYDWLRYPWFPYNYNLLYAAALQLGDDVLPHLVSALAGGLSTVIVYRLGIQHADRLTACIGAAIWIGLGDYCSAMIDMGTTLFLLMACVALWWWKESHPLRSGTRWAALAAFCLGLAVGSKYQALVFLPLVALFVAWHERKPSTWLLAVLWFLMPCAYWYGRNAIVTGDPFNPLGGPVFGFTGWTPTDHALQVADVRAHARMPNKLLWAAVLAPLSVAWKRSAAVRTAGWFCVYAAVVWVATSRYPRYLMTAFPLLAVMAALGWQVLFGWIATGMKRAVAMKGDQGQPVSAARHGSDGPGTWVAVVSLTVLAIVSGQHVLRNAAKISPTPVAREAFLRQHVRGYAAMDYVRRNANGRVYHVSLSQATYYGSNPIWGDDALGPWRASRFAGLKPAEMALELDRHGFDFVVISSESVALLVARPDFDTYFHLLYEEDGSRVYRILPAATP